MPTETSYLRRSALTPTQLAQAGEWAIMIDKASRSLKGRVPPTPMSRLDAHVAQLRLSCASVWVKDEGATAVGSFKLRGATVAIDALPEATHVVTASAGNHAQGVAVACGARGLPCTIFMPEGTDSVKVAAVRRLNPKATVRIEGKDFNAAYALAQAQVTSQGDRATFIPPFEHPAVIAGQGTIAPEMLEQVQAHGVPPKSLHAVCVPIGGGGLAAGIGAYIKAHHGDSVKVIGVQLQGAAAMHATLSAHPRPESAPSMKVDAFAGGTAVGRVGELTRSMCEAFVDEIMVVSREEAGAAALLLASASAESADGRQPEVSGCLAYAGLLRYSLEHAADVSGKHLLCVVSGSNIGPDTQRVLSAHAATGVPQLVAAAQTSRREAITSQYQTILDQLAGAHRSALATIAPRAAPVQRAARL